MRFVDLFAGLGGFRLALEPLGHECVFACEIDGQLQDLYGKNFPDGPPVHGDIRLAKDEVPEHDVLCAGFPCQPFSKSGAQAGMRDQTTGTLFHEIKEIVEKHRPTFVILENVGNFERHDLGRTWSIVKHSLEDLGYEVRGTEHVTSGGDGLISPHHLGFPHHRERFFAVASLGRLPASPFPERNRKAATSMADVVQAQAELSTRDREETLIGDQHRRCIEHWNALLGALPEERALLPSFPIWGDELEATYSYEQATPWAEVRAHENGSVPSSNRNFAPLAGVRSPGGARRGSSRARHGLP